MGDTFFSGNGITKSGPSPGLNPKSPRVESKNKKGKSIKKNICPLFNSGITLLILRG